jgi:hypothetical protein
MAKFNTNTSKTNYTPNTLNEAGFPAFERTDFQKEVASIILNSMINGDSNYESESDRLEKIENSVVQNLDNAEFLAKAMIYARNDGNLRSVTHFLAGVLVENVKGSSFLKPALEKTLIRPDDATEMVALWNSRNTKSIPNALRKAIKNRLESRWGAYQLKKYYGNGNVKVSNLINICHPTPKDDEQRTVFKQALEGTLPNIATAQTVNAGSTGDERAENYSMMLKERTLGYMALLKNLKNILEAGVSDETVDDICNLLRNENAVLKSRVLPFRFVQAYNIVSNIQIDKFKSKKILKAIEDGFVLSAGNIGIVQPGEKVALLLDESGSMQGWGRADDDKTPFAIGKTLMAAMLVGLDKENTIGWLWADNAREVNIDKGPMTFIKETKTYGGGTDLGSAIKGLIKTETVVDKIVIFTDMQENQIGGWGGKTFNESMKDYRKINPNVQVLFWNLEGYGGGTPMKLNHNVLEIAGYSDKMLQLVPKMWKNQDALVDEINAIEL